MIPVLVSGCALSPRADPTVFLVLAPMESSPEPAAAGAMQRLGVGPVTLPRYLDRPQLVTRTSATELRVHEHARWSAPLSELISESLAEQLRAQLGLEEAVRYPWPITSPPPLAIRIEVQQFEAVLPDSAVLRARWEVLDAAGGRVGEARAVDYRTHSPPNPGAVAPALSRLVALLAADISATLRVGVLAP